MRNLYLSVLAQGVSGSENFDPTIRGLINRYNDAVNGGAGDYTTVYPVTVGDCTDSVSLTIR